MMGILFEVRHATEADIASIAEITHEAFLIYKEMSGAETLDALNETCENIREDIKNRLVLIALSDDEPVGCVRVEIKPDNTAILTRFAVKVTCQNNGIGKAMMNHVDKIMQKKGVERISLFTASKVASLIRFYYGRGFYVEKTDCERGYIRAKLTKEYKKR